MSDYKSNNEYLKTIAGDESTDYHTNNEYLKQIAENGGSGGGGTTVEDISDKFTFESVDSDEWTLFELKVYKMGKLIYLLAEIELSETLSGDTTIGYFISDAKYKPIKETMLAGYNGDNYNSASICLNTSSVSENKTYINYYGEDNQNYVRFSGMYICND